MPFDHQVEGLVPPSGFWLFSYEVPHYKDRHGWTSYYFIPNSIPKEEAVWDSGSNLNSASDNWGHYFAEGVTRVYPKKKGTLTTKEKTEPVTCGVLPRWAIRGLNNPYDGYGAWVHENWDEGTPSFRFFAYPGTLRGIMEEPGGHNPLIPEGTWELTEEGWVPCADDKKK